MTCHKKQNQLVVNFHINQMSLLNSLGTVVTHKSICFGPHAVALNSVLGSFDLFANVSKQGIVQKMRFLASFKVFEDLAISPRSLRNSQLK